MYLIFAELVKERGQYRTKSTHKKFGICLVGFRISLSYPLVKSGDISELRSIRLRYRTMRLQI